MLPFVQLKKLKIELYSVIHTPKNLIYVLRGHPNHTSTEPARFGFLLNLKFKLQVGGMTNLFAVNVQ